VCHLQNVGVILVTRRRDARSYTTACARKNLARDLKEDVMSKLTGFASMGHSKRCEIASKGGKAAHAKGTAHEWSSEQAREAGRKGGLARAQRGHTLPKK
jgi:general stress protein YciG